ncbi:MAG TPA: T9SS type A sorting domain-containing protein, partial [Bacteroidia bacterium]|nr:T9SS type A sorting domain-containing protein [Bacteroidia bacterium]
KIAPVVGPDSVCEGASAIYSCSSFAGATFTWAVPSGSVINSGQGTDSVKVTFGSISGKIKVVGLSTCGNDSDSISVTVTPLPTLTISANKDTSCSAATKDSLMATPIGGVFSGAGVSGANFNPSLAGIGTHTVIYTYTNLQGCTNSDSLKLVVQSCLGINEVASMNDHVKLYPNPFSQSVNVNIDISGPVTVTIFNLMGQSVGTWAMDKGLNTINTSGMASGVYTIQVKTPGGILNKKLVKVD